MEFAFGCFQGESSFLNSSQECPDVPSVVFQILREDENVVQICHTEDSKVFAQNLVHPSLERRRCVVQPQRCDVVPVESVPGSEGCFQFVSCCDSEVVVGVSDIKFGVDSATG